MSVQQARLHQIPSACDRLGVGRSMLFELIKNGELGSVKVGRRRLVPESAIVAYIERLTREAVA
ncbi:excisionase family DNA-binding protein [Nocardia niigatensis]